MAASPTAYPLQWPARRPRTKSRVAGTFATTARNDVDVKKGKPVTLAEARTRLQVQLERLGATLPILSTNVELTLNGLPRSGGAQPADPGAALYFQLSGRAMVMACDNYTRVEQNIAAIAAHIDSTRRINRYGVATTEEMFAGFLALPAPSVMIGGDWRNVLENPTSREEAEAVYRRKMRVAHPDQQGGSDAAAAVLNSAIAIARLTWSEVDDPRQR